MLKGYIWLPTNIDGSKSLYFKNTKESVPVEFSPYDLNSIEFTKNNELYISEPILGYAGKDRVFAQVHLQGDYTLLSCNDSYGTRFFILDQEGNHTELLNGENQNNTGNRPQVYGSDYKNVLYRLFDTEDYLDTLINNANFSPEDLTRIIAKYHRKHNLRYEIFPIPPVTWYISAGTSVVDVKHKSDINNTFISKSPIINAHLGAGILTYNNQINIGLKFHYYNGTIYHDDNYEPTTKITAYYEDIYKVSILSNELYSSLRLLNAGNFNLSLGFGIGYNLYVGYERNIYEEIFLEEYDIVVSNHYSEEEKPKNTYKLNVFAGLEYEISNRRSIELSGGYHKFPKAESGTLSMFGIGLSVIQKIY